MSELSPIQNLKAMLSGGPDPMGLSIEEQREGMKQYVLINPPPENLSIDETRIENTRCVWVSAPNSRSDRVIYYTHGGAYMAGSPETHMAILGELAVAAEARVLAPDYRLAPEHRYPAAIDDTLNVYEWVTKQPGIQKTAIAGDSAGGGLAVACMIGARDRSLPLCDAILLFSPWADLTCTGHSYESKAAADFVVKPEISRKFAALYLDGADPQTPLASPAWGDLSNLPPILLQVGSSEVLLDDSLLLDRNARKAGVDVTLEVWPEMVHVWHAFTALLPDAKVALTRSAAYLKDVWGR